MFDAIYNQEVGVEWLLEVLLLEESTRWNLSHEKRHDDEQLLHLDSESHSSDLWAFPLTLDQTRLRFGVLELNCLNAANVVEIT